MVGIDVVCINSRNLVFHKGFVEIKAWVFTAAKGVCNIVLLYYTRYRNAHYIVNYVCKCDCVFSCEKINMCFCTTAQGNGFSCFNFCYHLMFPLLKILIIRCATKATLFRGTKGRLGLDGWLSLPRLHLYYPIKKPLPADTFLKKAKKQLRRKPSLGRVKLP